MYFFHPSRRRSQLGDAEGWIPARVQDHLLAARDHYRLRDAVYAVGRNNDRPLIIGMHGVTVVNCYAA